jgi:hypothetical protein
MANYKPTFLILTLILIPLLSACGTDGLEDTPSGALVTPSAESRLKVSEATSILTEPPVPTNTPIPPTPVPTEPPVPTDTPIPPTSIAVLPPPTLLYFWAQW